MRSARRFSSCTALALLWASAVSAAAPDYRLFAIGEARDPAGGTLLYREYHLEATSEPLKVVEYRLPDGALIASKTLLPGMDAAAPAFMQLDLRSGELLSARWQEQALALTHRADEGAAAETRTLAPPAAMPLVIDAGFDAFVRQQWDTLRSGKSIEFGFALPGRKTLVTLRAQETTCADGDGLTCFRIEPANALLRLVAEPIELAYRSADQRLAHFHGIANIQPPAEVQGAVSISYTYPQAAPLPGCQPVVFRDAVPPLDTLAAGCQVAQGD